MKALYLLFGLLLLTTISSALPTPFLIGGWVINSDGGPVYNPNVTITNLNTSEVFTAETTVNYYQLVLENISAGDVLIFNTTDGTGSNITEHDVAAGEIGNGAIFPCPFNITLAKAALTSTPTPRITGYAPDSPVYDTENATRTFNITIDQVVNVTWLIDGTEVFNETDVNESTYTNTNAVLGSWNVSVIVSNPNGTDMQTWTWHVNPLIKAPPSMFLIYGEVFYKNNTNVDAPYVVVTNLNTSKEFVADNYSGEYFYQIITSASEIRAGDVLLINASKDGIPAGSVNHTVTSNESRSGAIRVDINRGWADLQVMGIFPPPYILDSKNNTITATISNNGTIRAQAFNISFAVNGNITDRAYIRSLGVRCTENVTFNWTPEQTGYHLLKVTADPDGEIDESDEGNNDMNMTVFAGMPDFTITNLLFDTLVNLYDSVIINATVANYGVRDDTVEVSFYINDDDAPFDTAEVFLPAGRTGNATVIWNATLAANHFITAVADPNNNTPEINELNNSLSRQIFVDASDLTVTNIDIIGYPLDPEYSDDTEPMFEYPNNVTAVIINKGNLSADAVVEFYSELNISSAPIIRSFDGYGNESNDTIIQSGASKMRVHFIGVNLGTYSYVKIYDKNNNTVETISSPKSDYWSDWVDGDVIRIYAYIGATSDDITFYIDKYEYVFANATISIDANESTDVSKIWHADPAIIINEAQSRYIMLPRYTISAIVDPNDAVGELNESNNVCRTEAALFYPYDFTITNITFSTESPREGEPVTIDAAIKNSGFRSIGTMVAFYVDGNLLSIEDVYIEANKTEHIAVIWNVLPDINHLDEEHDITVIVDPNSGIDEQDEDNNAMSRLMNVTLSKLVITEISTDPARMIIGDAVDVIATIRNDENVIANDTVWFCEENYSIGIHDYIKAPKTPIIKRIIHHGAIMMKGHVTMDLSVDKIGIAEVYVNNRQVLTCTDGNHEWSGWTEWTSGSTKIINITIEADVPYNDFSINYSIDKYQAVFGNTTITIPANESVHPSINWTVTQKKPRLIVITSNATNSTDVFVSGTDLAVTDVSVSDNVVWDGDSVNITAAITNFGGMNASNITVEFYDILQDVDQESLINITDISCLDAGDSINITVPWTACLKVEGDVSYNHSIKVKAKPQDSHTEDNPENDAGDSDTIVIKRSRDFSVTNILFFMNNETLNTINMGTGELTIINATIDITNLASYDGSVDVSCYLDNTIPIDTVKTVLFPVDNETVHAEFEWVVCAHGNHTITVIADPENETSEFNESNNAFNQEIYIRTPDFAVTGLTFDPESPEEGEPVNITATVDNLGNMDVDNVNLTIYDCIDVMYYDYESPDWYTPGQPIIRNDATAMKLYIKLRVLDGYLHLYDCQNQSIASYNKSFDGRMVWTPWAFGSHITIEHEGSAWGGIWLYGSEYTTGRNIINTTNLTLMADDSDNITMGWSTSTAGEHQVFAIIDPEDAILESDESNNEFSRTMIVQGTDLAVSDMQVTANDTVIKAGEVVNINATITNVGIKPVKNFNVSFCINDIEITNRTNLSLNISESVNVFAAWNSTIGNYTIAVTADPENYLHETNESNNMAVTDVSVQGADLLITNILYIVIPPDNATTNDTGGRIFDTDTILVNTTITNQGILPADNFYAHIFYEKMKLGDFDKLATEGGDKRWKWINKTLKGSECVYVKIQNSENIEGNIKIYDMNGSVAACPEGDGWFFVDGDEANVWFHSTSGVGIRMDFYAGDFQRYDNLSIGNEQPKNLTMLQQVFTGNNAIKVFVDPENNVCENNKDNNYADQALIIHPSRDFTVNNVQLFHNGSAIGINDMMMDGDTVRVNTMIGMNINESDPYHEYRNGNADVAITDEHEWVNVPPRFKLTPYGYAQVITYPRVNALRVHFEELSLPWGGCVEIRDKNWIVQWSRCWDSKDEFAHNSSWVNGDTVYIYKVEKPTATTPVWGRITFSIDKYQYRMLNHTTMLLNASETRNITTKWNVSAGNHSIQVITDIEDTVGEINESNNEIRRPLYVSACKDPTILDIIFDPQKPAVGSDVLINTLIANQGNRTVSFTVDLWAEKTEYHPFESQHDDDFPAWVCPGGCEWSANPEWEIPSTYPDADWMGIHFKKIEMRKKIGETTINRNLYVHDENDTMMDNFCGSDENDIWVWVQGNKIKLSTTKCPIFPGYHVWGFNITDHRYRIILNHTTLTLAPNETANVTGMLKNVRAGNHSMNYTIHANLDMDNAIYEMNESNNEIVKILNLAVPDFKVDINPPTKYSGISAVFKNIGFGSTDTRVFFSREVDYSIRKSGSRYIRVPAKNDQIPDNIELDDIDWIRVHFKKSNMKDGGYLEVGNERYEKSESDFWSPWVRGDRVSIKYTRTSFEIDRYEFAEEDFIDDFGAGGRVCLDIPWEGYTEPYNLTVWVDPFDEILEGNEDNNKDTALVYMDIMADRIEFVSPDEDMLSLDAEQFVINGYITNGGFKDGIAFPVSDFNVTLEFRRWYPNGTIGESVFNSTEHIEGPFYTGQKTTRFEFDPSEKLEAGGNYTVRLIADSAGDVSESNEENNIASEEIFVYNFSGYTGGGELINVAQGEVRGRVVYTVGDKDSCEYSGMTPTGGKKTVKYTGVVPDDASNIEFARIFVHWFTWKLEDNRLVPVLADMDATFNGHSLIMSGNYSDNPGATMNDAGYGLYSFDVAKYVTKGENEATVRITSDWSVGIHAIGLLVVYEDEDEPLTKYWINEGADIVMAANDAIPSGLSDGDCITTALFDGVEREDTDNVNATLLTVLGFYAKYGEPSDDALKFNDQLTGSIIHTSNISGNWEYHYRDTGIALTKNRWDDVTDHLKCGNNLADIQSQGNYMMPNNAFLRLIFPPDLAVTDIAAPISAVVGKRYVINTTISNVGRSNTTDFNVSFYSNGMKIGRQKVSRLNSGDNITLQFNWKPMYMGKIYTLKAVADELSGPDWVELDFDNNVMTKNVPIVEAGFGNESGPVGAGGEGIGGDGKGSGTSLLDAITGYLMKGTVLGGKESGGGGGRGEYSLLGWIMKFAVLTAGILIVCTSYMIERQKYKGRK